MNSDNGIPPLNDTQSFSVVVSSRPQFTGSAAGTNGQVEIQFTTLPGQNYLVQYKTNLTDAVWTPLSGTMPGAGSPLTVSENLSGGSQRFYRLLVLPQ